jgi:hypothetical protein
LEPEILKEKMVRLMDDGGHWKTVIETAQSGRPHNNL